MRSKLRKSRNREKLAEMTKIIKLMIGIIIGIIMPGVPPMIMPVVEKHGKSYKIMIIEYRIKS